MDDQELRHLLEQLHHEIEHTNTIDEKGSELLRNVGEEIDQLLDRSQNELVQPQQPTTQSLEDTINYLEVTHPTLTLILSKLLAILSNSGI